MPRPIILLACSLALAAAPPLAAATDPQAEREANIESLHREALRRKAADFGPDAPATASAMRDLGLLLLFRNRAEEAAPYFQDALRARERAGAPPGLEAARDGLGLAQALHQLGEANESRRAAEQALVACGQADPGDPDLKTQIHLLLAELALFSDALENAARHYSEAITVQPNPATMLQLAEVQTRLGNQAAAAETLSAALALRTAPGEPPHPETGEILHQLALLATDRGGFVEARSLIERAGAVFAASSGVETAAAAAAADTFGNILRATGELDAATRVLDATLGLRRQILGPRHPDVASTLNNLAGAHHLAGRLAAAEPLYREAISILEEQPGPPDIRVAESLNNLGYLLASSQRPDEAAAAWRRSLATLERLGLESSPLAGDVRAALASAAAR